MPFIWIQILDVDTEHASNQEDINCPICGSSQLHGWGKVTRRAGEIQRYRCVDCGHTFRDPSSTPEKIDLRATIQQVAGAAWVLGISTRKIEELFAGVGEKLSRSLIWRTGKGMLHKLQCAEHKDQRHTIDSVYIPGISEDMGVVVGVVFPTQSRVILGTLAETDPRQVKTCLEDLLSEASVHIDIGTNGLLPLWSRAGHKTCPLIIYP